MAPTVSRLNYTVIHTPWNTPYEQSRVQLYYNGQLLSEQQIAATELSMETQQECWFNDYHKDDFWFYMSPDHNTGKIHKYLVKNNASNNNKIEIYPKKVKYIEVPAQTTIIPS